MSVLLNKDSLLKVDFLLITRSRHSAGEWARLLEQSLVKMIATKPKLRPPVAKLWNCGTEAGQAHRVAARDEGTRAVPDRQCLSYLEAPKGSYTPLDSPLLLPYTPLTLHIAAERVELSSSSRPRPSYLIPAHGVVAAAVCSTPTLAGGVGGFLNSTLSNFNG